MQATTGNDIRRVALDGPLGATAFIETEWSEYGADVSPNGRWVAHQSNRSGRREVYVRPFPTVEAGLRQVSVDGGSRPVWSKNGRELFYAGGEAEDSMMAVPVQTDVASFLSGRPQRLFEYRYHTGTAFRAYDVNADAARFLMIKTPESRAATPASMVVVLHWVEGLNAVGPAQ